MTAYFALVEIKLAWTITLTTAPGGPRCHPSSATSICGIPNVLSLAVEFDPCQLFLEIMLLFWIVIVVCINLNSVLLRDMFVHVLLRIW